MDFSKIDKEIQKYWEAHKIFEAEDKSKKTKYYCLDMFPYPSGEGLHVGHVKGYTASDIISRYKMMKGYNVLHPMGWDAFGLPAENYALKVGKKPQETVKENIEKFKKQLKELGYGYDWSREINTTDPDYYKWTQWIFLKIYKKGLAYQSNEPINFCPSCKTGLANEEVVSGLCERCGTKVEKKRIRQWVLKITAYADRLLNDLDKLDWPEPILEMQRNWIGKSTGSIIKFKIKDEKYSLNVFTTRADTLFGATYMVVAPEHEIIEKFKAKIKNYSDVEKYVDKSVNKSDLERAELEKEKTGVELKGLKAINPANNKEIPIWVADYVLYHYGTGAVMAVPAHDERDFEFAKKYHLELRQVIKSDDKHIDLGESSYEGNGTLINSDNFSHLESEKAKKEITAKLKKINAGGFAVNYKLRDWVFSRQRYWGEPIPLIHCKKCGVVPVQESELPVRLPEIEKYEPTGNGESPLANVKDWVNTKCPKCAGSAKRETNTMPQWAGSCWYYLRYLNPRNNKVLCEASKEKYFMPVDLYIGGAEHAVLHLLYARFWHKVLYDEKIVSTDEPFKKLQNVGLILAADHQKMSKSRGNIVNPGDIISRNGVDAFRMYEMFIGPFNQPASWSPNGISGPRKFIEKIYSSFKNKKNKRNSMSIDKELKQLVCLISNKIEKMQFNTAVSDFMKFSNIAEMDLMTTEQWNIFLKILSPFAPHICEKMWQDLGEKESILKSNWPKFKKASKDIIPYIVQINGKKRALINQKQNLNEQNITLQIFKNTKLNKYLKNKIIKKTIFIKNKLINFVI